MKKLVLGAFIALSLAALTPDLSHAGKSNGYNGNGKSCNNGNNHRVPEPATMALLGAAIGAIVLKARKTEE